MLFLKTIKLRIYSRNFVIKFFHGKRQADARLPQRSSEKNSLKLLSFRFRIFLFAQYVYAFSFHNSSSSRSPAPASALGLCFSRSLAFTSSGFLVLSIVIAISVRFPSRPMRPSRRRRRSSPVRRACLLCTPATFSLFIYPRRQKTFRLLFDEGEARARAERST